MHTGREKTTYKVQPSRHLRSTADVNETRQFVALINNEFMCRVMRDTRSRSECSTAAARSTVCVIQLSQVLLEGRARFTGGATAMPSPYWCVAVTSAYQERTQSLSSLFLDKIQMSPGRVWICKKRNKNDRISLPFTAKPLSDACDILCAETGWGWWNTTLMLSARIVIAISLNTPSEGQGRSRSPALAAARCTSAPLDHSTVPFSHSAIVIVECL